jgi:hypothetical protein
MDTNLVPVPPAAAVDVPTGAFRRASWKRFQRNLDPLGAPRPLPATQWARNADDSAAPPHAV